MNATSIFVRYYINLIYSFCANVFFWIFNIHKLNKTKLKRDAFLRKCVRNRNVLFDLSFIKEGMKKFQYVNECVDWTPWFLTLVARDFKDDCDGAAVLAQALCFNTKNHIKYYGGEILTLWNETTFIGHDVYVDHDLELICSNNEVIYFSTQKNGGAYLERASYKAILSKFDNYTIVSKKGIIVYRKSEEV